MTFSRGRSRALTSEVCGSSAFPPSFLEVFNEYPKCARSPCTFAYSFAFLHLSKVYHRTVTICVCESESFEPGMCLIDILYGLYVHFPEQRVQFGTLVFLRVIRLTVFLSHWLTLRKTLSRRRPFKKTNSRCERIFVGSIRGTGNESSVPSVPNSSFARTCTADSPQKHISNVV